MTISSIAQMIGAAPHLSSPPRIVSLVAEITSPSTTTLIPGVGSTVSRCAAKRRPGSDVSVAGSVAIRLPTFDPVAALDASQRTSNPISFSRSAQ